MWAFLLWAAVAYLVIGIIMTIILSQTPYAENAWLLSILLWPLFFIAMFG